MIKKWENAQALFTLDIRYAGNDNLTGQPLCGYCAPALYGTEALLNALETAAGKAKDKGFELIVYDAYRPQKAVDGLVAWTRSGDERMKAKYFPKVDKNNMLALGYIAARSGHSRGATVDLSLLKDGLPLDMGTAFDFMDPLSSHGAQGINEAQKQNRLALLALMTQCGFKPYQNEWWHYTLLNEPFPNTYFDVDIT